MLPNGIQNRRLPRNFPINVVVKHALDPTAFDLWAHLNVQIPVFPDLSILSTELSSLASSSNVSGIPSNVVNYGLSPVQGPSNPYRQIADTQPSRLLPPSNSRNALFMASAAAQIGKHMTKPTAAPVQHPSDNDVVQRTSTPSGSSPSRSRVNHLGAVQNSPARAPTAAATSPVPVVASSPSQDAVMKRTSFVRPGVARHYTLPLSLQNNAARVPLPAARAPHPPTASPAPDVAPKRAPSASPGVARRHTTSQTAAEATPRRARPVHAPAGGAGNMPVEVDSLDDALSAWNTRFDAQPLVEVLLASKTPTAVAKALAGIVAPLLSGTLRIRRGAGPALDAAVVNRTAILLLWLREKETAPPSHPICHPFSPPFVVDGEDHDDDETDSDGEQEMTVDAMSTAVAAMKVEA
ncbi:hypothetical protein BDK51DRAFT_45671 [Blyttiomyces helicus]|uniref:Uncharacterized protein n=1 Tax=Blyttiomyces helicus TaxID=388810 RepID=A0A4P9WLC1_9FUNG|nr:hypothetical protein BDK51DRAFT_45671 [Blyttiomyces helicus]|eukprot:RKO91446.1 hypothetical protein BDK51DRAFT_45671 [Blyttiomyces helicus]